MSATLLFIVLLVAAIGCAAALIWLVARRRLVTLEQRLADQDAEASKKAAIVMQAQTLMREAFAAASQDALQKSGEVFLQLARASLGEFQNGARTDLESRQHSIEQIIAPVNESLQQMKETLKLLDLDRATTQATLVEHLRNMSHDQEKLICQTTSLVRALRTPNVRGQWGEMQLRRTVELAGMLDHCDFTLQQTINTNDGRLRPDLIVHLPLSKMIIVDAKAPLSAYLDAMETIDDRQKSALLDRHASQVRAHIDALAAKDYSNQFPEAPDFVVLFLPGEAFFSAACERDPALLDYAVGRGVIPSSPTTLITLLKSVAYGWQQERIAERAEQIRDLGAELHDRVCTFADHIAKVRKGLDTAVTAYNSAVGSLETRVLPKARQLRELGVSRNCEIEVLEPVTSMTRVTTIEHLGLSSDVIAVY